MVDPDLLRILPWLDDMKSKCFVVLYMTGDSLIPLKFAIYFDSETAKNQPLGWRSLTPYFTPYFIVSDGIHFRGLDIIGALDFQGFIERLLNSGCVQQEIECKKATYEKDRGSESFFV